MRYHLASICLLAGWSCNAIAQELSEFGIPTSTSTTDAIPSPRANTTSKPVPINYGVVLFPAFQLLDVFGPLDALSLLAITHQVNLYTIAESRSALQYILSVCTGAELSAKAGILDGKRATTNKAAWKSTIASGPKTNWIPQARWVEDGNVWTSSGISAGIDLTWAFIEEMYGRPTAERVTTYLEYERHEDPSWDPFAVVWNLATVS
ncbi:MAG: hypothetical protein M1823_000429 [Watsoniomyces obsoletus]|nr:MAG: hypothetical protein M1823_000429 [Watsoniomyces obsoletus]